MGILTRKGGAEKLICTFQIHALCRMTFYLYSNLLDHCLDLTSANLLFKTKNIMLVPN